MGWKKCFVRKSTKIVPVVVSSHLQILVGFTTTFYCFAPLTVVRARPDTTYGIIDIRYNIVSSLCDNILFWIFHMFLI